MIAQRTTRKTARVINALIRLRKTRRERENKIKN
jgi:hypothetical protein